MQLTKRGEYALRTLIRLGISQETGRESLTVSELAAAQRLPVKFVEQILLQLGDAGYVGTEGAQDGGYSIGKPLEAIRFSDVIQLIDGLPSPVAKETSGTRQNEDDYGLSLVMSDVHNSAVKVLERYTLREVVDATLRKVKQDEILVHFEAPGFLPPASKNHHHAGSHDGLLATP